MKAFSPVSPEELPIQHLSHDRIAFSSSFHDMASRAGFSSEAIERASQEEVRQALSLASETLGVVEFNIAARIHAHNPDCFRLVRSANFANSAMMAYLPLNSQGTAALVDGHFDGQAPDLGWVCAQDERPDSIYLWLVYAPGKMVSGLRLVQELEALGSGCPIFTRPAHQVSARILAKAGFLPASDLFPSSPEWLVVALPEAPCSPAYADIRVRVARTLDDIMKVFSIRTATYMTEQKASYAEEFDGNDLCGTHLLAEVGGEPAACVRIRYFGDFAKLERLAVRPEYRQSRVMFRTVRASFDHCRKKGFRRLYAHAREDLVPAWQRFGARVLEDRPPFSFSDITFREMYLDLEPSDDAVVFGGDPMVAIRPEGEWDRMGPLDKAQLHSSKSRRGEIEANVRRLRAQ